MKKILLFLQIFALAIVLIGSNSVNVFAEGEGENNRTITINNMLTYGDFESDNIDDIYNLSEDGHADGWYGYVQGAYIAGGKSAGEIIDGIQRVYLQSDYLQLGDYIELRSTSEIYFNNDDIYYFSTYFDGSGSNADNTEYMYFGGNSISFNTEQTTLADNYSFNFSFESYEDSDLYYTVLDTLHHVSNIWADNAILVNLTTYFGEGREPSLEEFETILLDNEVGDFFTSFPLTYYDSDPNGDIKTLSTMISALYEPYTFTNFQDSLVGEENILTETPILNEVYGNIIPPLFNDYENYLSDFYLKTERTYDDFINSTYGDITPLEAEPILNEVQGLMLNQLVNNGDFVSGITNWSSSYSTNTETNDILSNSGDGSNSFAWLFQNDVLKDDVNYYLKAKVRVTNDLAVRISYWNGGGMVELQSDPIENQWYDLSVVFTASNDTFALLQHQYSNSTDQLNSVMEIDEFIVISIDNTPLASKTASEIDLIVGDYFEGTDYITDFSLQSTGLNLFDGIVSNGYSLDSNGDLSVDANRTSSTNYISVIGGESYSFTNFDSLGGLDRFIIVEYDYDKNLILRTANISETLVLQSSTKYIRFTLYDSTVSLDYSGGTTFQVEQGTTATTYVDYNSATLILTEDLLSVGTDIRDIAYSVNDTWFKDQYVERDYNDVIKDTISWGVSHELTDTIRFYKDLSSLLDYGTPIDSNTIPNISLRIGDVIISARHSSGNTTVDSEYIFIEGNTLLFRINKSRLSTNDSVGLEAYLLANDVEFIFELDTVVTTEITATGSLIQESNTTLLQLNNFATEYDIDFITSLDDSNTDYYYNDTNSLLVDLEDSYGSGNEPTLNEFEDILDYLDLTTFTEYTELDYIEDFTLQTVGANIFDNTQDKLQGKLNLDGTYDPLYFDYYVSDYVEVNENTEYSGGNLYNHIFYDETFTYLGYTGGNIFTTPENTKYIKFTILISEWDNFHLNLGSELFDYSDYVTPTSLTLLTDLLIIGDIRDRAYSVNEDLDISDNEVWYKDSYIGRDYNDILQSATGWTLTFELTDSNRFSIDLSTLLGYETYALEEVGNIYLKIGDIIYPYMTLFDMTTTDSIGVGTYGTNIYIRVLKIDATDSTTLESYLQANNVEIIFALDTVVTTEISYTGSLFQEENLVLNQLDNLFTEYQIDIMLEEPYLSTRYYEDLTEINPFYQYDDYELSVDDEPMIELTLVETMYYQFDSYPEIYIVKYDIDGNYIADIYSNYIYDFTYIDTNRLHSFSYTLPITSAEEEMYMWIAYNGVGGTVMGAGYVAEATSTAFNTVETDVRSLEYALGVNGTVYLDIALGYQYDHLTTDYVVDSTDPIIIAHFRSDTTTSDIIFYNENTEDTYSFSLSDIQSDFSSNEIISYKIYNSFVVFSTSNEFLGSMDYLLGLDVSIDFIEDLGGTMIDYSNIFNGYNDLGVFTYNLMDGSTIEAQGEAPIFYGGNPYIIDMTNHSVRYGNIVNVTLGKTSENFDNEYDNYFLYDSNSLEYFTNDFDIFAYDNILRYILYEGFAIDETIITFKAESTEDYLNGTDKSDYYISISDTYEMRGATGIQDGVDGWLSSVGLSDSTGKAFISVIIIIGFTILLAVLKANFVTILIVDFGIIGLLALLGFIPLWIILFIIIIVMVLIFFTRRE